MTEPGDKRRTMRHISRTLPHIHDDGRDADDIVFLRGELVLEGLPRGKIEHRAGRRDVLLNHHDSPGPVEHA
jgi:hypothetical protein